MKRKQKKQKTKRKEENIFNMWVQIVHGSHHGVKLKLNVKKQHKLQKMHH